MRPMNDNDRLMFMWFDHKEWYEFGKDGNAVFKPDTPKKILESYKAWKNRK